MENSNKKEEKGNLAFLFNQVDELCKKNTITSLQLDENTKRLHSQMRRVIDSNRKGKTLKLPKSCIQFLP